jgi:hypothetical protein
MTSIIWRYTVTPPPMTPKIVKIVTNIPLIQPDEKTKDDASGHGQADLHNNRQVFGPGSIFLIIKRHLGVTESLS